MRDQMEAVEEAVGEFEELQNENNHDDTVYTQSVQEVEELALHFSKQQTENYDEENIALALSQEGEANCKSLDYYSKTLALIDCLDLFCYLQKLWSMLG